MAQRPAEEIAREGYEAWNTGDFEQFIATVHPEIVWVGSGLFPGLRESYAGHEEMREFWNAFLEPWETLEIEIDRLTSIGDDGLLLMAHFHARGRDGIEVARSLANHLVMKDDKLYRFRSFQTWEEAVATVGAETA